MKNVHTLMENVYTQIWKVESKVYIPMEKSIYPNGKGLSLTWQSWSQYK